MDFLKDPKGDRQVPAVQPPPLRPLPQELLFPHNFKGKPNWKLLRDHLAREGRIKKEDLVYIVNQASKLMKNEGNLLYLEDPVTIVGDIHGQYYDFLKILELGGLPDNSKYKNNFSNRYLFLGDFVDRGAFSCEVITLLYALKIYYPNKVFLLRGNHESRQLTSFFNFKDECKHKYDQEVYEILMDSFDNLPLAALVNGKFLCLHGGISPELKIVTDIERIDRFREPPKQGLFCDLLWSDPVENEDIFPELMYKGNEVRGCSWYFGEKALEPILEQNNLICVIRAHEAQLEGFRTYKWNEEFKEFPPVLTVFSAPNYCDVYNNKGAIIKFSVQRSFLNKQNGNLNIQQFVYTQHPYLLPHFLDIFTWSIPFVSEKVTEMLFHILKPNENDLSDDDLNEIQPNLHPLQKSNTMGSNRSGLIQKPQAEVMRKKIKFVSKMMMMQRVLREENENIVRLKGYCPDNRIPRGLLSEGADAIKDALAHFNKVKGADQINEKWPENMLNPQKEKERSRENSFQQKRGSHNSLQI